MTGSDLPTFIFASCALAILAACAVIFPSPVATPEPPAGAVLTRSRDGMHTIRVPTGSFLMGSTDAEVDRALQLCEEAYGDCQREWFEDEQRAHEVTLDAFHIDQTEVTNGQFAAFLNAQKDEAEGDLTWGGVMLDLGSEHCLIEQVEGQFRPEEGYADHPAITVSWYGAKAYCAWVGAPASHRGGMGVRCSRDRSASLSLGRHLRRVALELLRRE